MSIQQCYESFIINYLLLNDYKIFNSLVNYGFIVRECLKSSNLKSDTVEMKTDINDEVHTLTDYETGSIIKKSEHGKLTKKQIFDRLNNFVPSIQLKDIKRKLVTQVNSSQSPPVKSNKYAPKFDVYLPNKNFKKSQPGDPMFRISTQCKPTNESLYLPKLIDFIECNDSENSSGKSLFGFANDSDPIYYSFNCEFSFPRV